MKNQISIILDSGDSAKNWHHSGNMVHFVEETKWQYQHMTFEIDATER
jgi:hypothetical protein